MITRPTTIAQLKQMFLELFLSKTTVVTKVSPTSLVNATGFGVAKLSQKILKDVAVLESNIFPEAAFGTTLDSVAKRYGVPARFGSAGSSTYVRLVGDVGTAYLLATHKFTGSHGIVFSLTANITIGTIGYTYAKVQSDTQGDDTNVDALTLTKITPSAPTGHLFVVNDYKAFGGRDAEDDRLFRQRIEEGANILAEGTLAKYEQVFMKINNDVLRIYKGGINSKGEILIYISTVNGTDLTTIKLKTISDKSDEFLSLSDQQSGLELKNITYLPIDVTMRMELESGAVADTVRKNMQVSMQKILDWRYWVDGSSVEWEDLLFVAKRTKDVKRVLDNFFFPDADIVVPDFNLPRIRSFAMLDINGAILSDTTGVLNPAFFPAQLDYSFQQTALKSI